MSGWVTAAKTVGALAAALGIGATSYAVDMPGAIRAQVAGPEVVEATPSAKPRATMAPFVKVVGSKATSSSRGDRTVAPAPTRSPTPAVALCATAGFQRAVERALSSLADYEGVIVDGMQSAGDCALIRQFQQRFGVEPASGQADATTADVARRIVASSTRQNLQRCGADDDVAACVDLTLQTVWVVRDGVVVLGPTVTRTGMRGYATPEGTYRINKRDLREWSEPYEVWLPYWQRFVDGIGFHESITYIHDATLGSHGCVNLLHRDAVALFDELHMGTTVRVFGRRPGT